MTGACRTLLLVHGGACYWCVEELVTGAWRNLCIEEHVTDAWMNLLLFG